MLSFQRDLATALRRNKPPTDADLLFARLDSQSITQATSKEALRTILEDYPYFLRYEYLRDSVLIRKITDMLTERSNAYATCSLTPEDAVKMDISTMVLFPRNLGICQTKQHVSPIVTDRLSAINDTFAQADTLEKVDELVHLYGKDIPVHDKELACDFVSQAIDQHAIASQPIKRESLVTPSEEEERQRYTKKRNVYVEQPNQARTLAGLIAYEAQFR